MERVESIRLQDVKCYASFREVPLGCLVQVQINDVPAVCIKSVMDIAGQGKLYLGLVVAGEACGLLIADDDAGGVCLDLTDLVDLIAVDPCRTGKMRQPLQTGAIYKSTTQDAWFMWSSFPLDPSQVTTQWVCISDDGKSNQVGSIHTGLNRANLIGVALRSGIELKIQPISN